MRKELGTSKRRTFDLVRLLWPHIGEGAPCPSLLEIRRAATVFERLGEEWDPSGSSTLKSGYVRCIVCNKPLKTDGVSINGRRNAQFRLCAGKCWNYARGLTADLARKEGLDGTAAFNRLLSQLIWNHQHEVNQSNHGQPARIAF